MAIVIGPIMQNGTQTVQHTNIYEGTVKTAIWKKDDVDKFVNMQKQENKELNKKNWIIAGIDILAAILATPLTKNTKIFKKTLFSIAGIGMLAILLNTLYQQKNSSQKLDKEFDTIYQGYKA